MGELLENRRLLAGAGWQAAPEGGVSLLPDATPEDDLFLSLQPGAAATQATLDVDPADGVPFDRAVRVAVTNPGDEQWSVQLVLNTVGDVAAGDTVLLTFFARGGGGDSGPVRAEAYLQQIGGSYSKLASAEVAAGGAWTQYLAPAGVSAAQPDGTHQFVVHLGFQPQTVEIGGLEILNYGDRFAPEELPRTRVTYDGRDPAADWRAAADRRIDQLRKADLTVEVVDQYGRAVDGAAVRAEMTRHEFGFGTAVDAFLLGVTETEFAASLDWASRGMTWQDVRTYRDTVEANFNKVVLENDLKLGGWLAGESNDNGRFRRVWTDRALDWLAERDIEVRGHYGVWGVIDPGDTWDTGGFDTSGGRDSGYDRFLLDHLEDKIPAVGARVAEWDAVNHPVGWGPETLLDRYGIEFYRDVFARMRELAPGAELWINEDQILSGDGNLEPYLALVNDLIAAGQTPDGVGFMGHFTEGSLLGVPDLLDRLDRFAAVVPKLQLTELDVFSYDRELQADYLGDVLTAAFSHEAMDGVVQWGFYESNHWRPEASLWREDWSLRPSGERFRELLFDRWWTDEAVQTDGDGAASIRGFKGNYTVTVTVGEEAQTFDTVLADGGQVLRAVVQSDAPPVEPPVEPPTAAAVGQSGTLTVSQSSGAQWHRVNFDAPIADAVVVTGPPTSNGGQPVTVRVRGVSESGFEFQLDEWDYLDGYHVAETLSWIAVGAGTHELEDGSTLVAGSTTARHRWAGVDLSAAGLTGTPVVFAQAASGAETRAVTTRLRRVTADGFQVKLQTQEAGNRRTAAERVDWIALTPPADAAATPRSGLTGDVVTHRDHRIAFGSADGPAAPVILAQMQSADGGDAATLRLRAGDSSGATVFVEEERSRDRERWHTTETVGWWALSPGVLLARVNPPAAVAGGTADDANVVLPPPVSFPPGFDPIVSFAGLSAPLAQAVPWQVVTPPPVDPPVRGEEFPEAPIVYFAPAPADLSDTLFSEPRFELLALGTPI